MDPSTRLRWIEGRCYSYGQDMAYHLVQSLLHSIIGTPITASEAETRSALGRLLELLFPADWLEVYPYLGHLLNLELEGEAQRRVQEMDPQAHQTQAQAALRRLLTAWLTASRWSCDGRPAWSDPSPVSFLTRCCRWRLRTLLFCQVMRGDPNPRTAPGDRCPRSPGQPPEHHQPGGAQPG
jgi:hypothetical protein